MEGEQKIPYPKSIPFILTTEFCERFSYYGMRGWHDRSRPFLSSLTSECAAILVLFVTRVIGFSDTDASVLFHGFTVVAYLTPILGAILADSFIGNYRAVSSLSLLQSTDLLRISWPHCIFQGNSRQYSTSPSCTPSVFRYRAELQWGVATAMGGWQQGGCAYGSVMISIA